MNNVKLTDFDMETLSQVSYVLKYRIALMISYGDPTQKKELDNLLEFNTQVLYAFSIVKEREKTLSN